MQSAVLDSDSLLQELFSRHDFSANQLRDYLTLPETAGTARSRRQQREAVKRARLTSREFRDNERYNFKLTSLHQEVHCQLLKEVYDDEGRWRRSTDMHCRYDGQPITGCPVAMPVKYSNRHSTYYVCKAFCSFPCCLSFIKQLQLDQHERERRIRLLHQMARKYFGVYARIGTALPLEALRIYGGHMELEVWREAAVPPHHTLLLDPPIEPFDEIVIERIHDFEHRKRRHEFYYGRNEEERQQKESARQQKLESDVQQAGQRETNRLKQKMAQGANTLFASMGITIVENS
jgi:hypothetical protein